MLSNKDSNKDFITNDNSITIEDWSTWEPRLISPSPLDLLYDFSISTTFDQRSDSNNNPLL